MDGTNQGRRIAEPTPAEPQQSADPTNGAKGTPDPAQKAKRESLESRVKDLESELAASKEREASLENKLKDALSADDVKAAVQKVQEEAQAEREKAAQDYAAREKSLTVANALLGAGCSDTVAMMAHLNMDDIDVAKDGHISGLDTATLAESYPYLFSKQNVATQNAGSAPTINSAATPGNAASKVTRAEINRIKDPVKRREMIAQHMDLYENERN